MEGYALRQSEGEGGMARVWFAMVWGIALVWLGGIAQAAPNEEMLRQVELSLLVKGRIEVDATGAVRDYRIEQPERLPPAVIDAIAQRVPAWRFEPVIVEGKPVDAAVDMSLRFVATPQADGGFSVRLRAAAFDDPSGTPEERVRGRSLRAPDYPSEAARDGVPGTVYLLVKVGRDGKVIDSVVEQVNLEKLAKERDMERWRKTLSHSAMMASRRWSFLPPTQGEQAQRSDWLVRVPVVFRFKERAYGEWETHVPGPRQPNPWAGPEGIAFSPEALVPGKVHPAESGLRLIGGDTGG